MNEIKGIVVNGTTYGLEDETTKEIATEALNNSEKNTNDIVFLENENSKRSQEINGIITNVDNLTTELQTVKQTADNALAKADEYKIPKAKSIIVVKDNTGDYFINEYLFTELLPFDISIANSGNHAVVLIASNQSDELITTLADIYYYRNQIRMDCLNNKNFQQKSSTTKSLYIGAVENVYRLKITPISFFNENK